ncbi:MAG: hypothetical protein GXY68_06915 [Chloroflexi bacterium]|mgnify:CR=1 FL=1|nr:hypothetical protein [Chloroflexota bacterium]
MPRNPNKRPCQVPGCRAWAKHGHELCSSHLTSRAIGSQAQRVLPLLRLAARAPEPAPLTAKPAPLTAKPAPLTAKPAPLTAEAAGSAGDDPLAVIDEELRQLLAARARFSEWLDADPDAAVTPTQFLRAWSDSATRVVQLLRARAELRGEHAGALDALMQSVYDEIEALLAAPPDEERPAPTEVRDGQIVD